MNDFLSLTGKWKKITATCKIPSITSQMLFMAPSLLTPCYRHTKNWGSSPQVLPQPPTSHLSDTLLASLLSLFRFVSYHSSILFSSPTFLRSSQAPDTSLRIKSPHLQPSAHLRGPGTVLFWVFLVLTQCLSHTHTPHTMRCSGCLNITFWEICEIPSFQWEIQL